MLWSPGWDHKRSCSCLAEKRRRDNENEEAAHRTECGAALTKLNPFDAKRAIFAALTTLFIFCSVADEWAEGLGHGIDGAGAECRIALD